MDLLEAATRVREHAYAPYSKFKVGAALKTSDGQIFTGCNVENAAYPEGTCAEAGAIAAMVAAGHQMFTQIVVVSDNDDPISPCGGCRQKLAEFATGDATVIMATLKGARVTRTLKELLPGAFSKQHMTTE